MFFYIFSEKVVKETGQCDNIKTLESTADTTNVSSDQDYAQQKLDTRKESDSQANENYNHDTPSQSPCYIFCGASRKKIRGNSLQLFISKKTEDVISFIREDAVELNDIELVNKITSEFANYKQIYYHNYCRNAYQNKVRSLQNAEKEKSEWHETRDINKSAFDNVCSYVQENIIKGERAFFLDFMQALYKSNLKEELLKRGEDNVAVPFQNRYLETKLLNEFGIKNCS